MPGRGAGQRATRDRADTTHGAGNRNEQVAGVIESHLPDRPLEEDVAPGDEGPGLAAVRRLVDAHARFRIARGIRLARARVQRVSGSILRIDEQGTDRVDTEAAGDESPVRAQKRLVGPPDTASRRRDVERALILGARRRDRHRRHAAARHVLGPVEQERIEHGGVGRLAGADQLPGAGRRRARIERRPAVPGIQGGLSRYLGLGVRPQQVRFDLGSVIRPTGFVGPDESAFVVARAHVRIAFLEDEGARRRRAGRMRFLHRHDGHDHGGDAHRGHRGQTQVREARPRSLVHNISFRVIEWDEHGYRLPAAA